MNITQQTWGGEKGLTVIVEADVDLQCMSVATRSSAEKSMRYRMDIYHLTMEVVDSAGKEINTKNEEGKDDTENVDGEADDDIKDKSARPRAPYHGRLHPLDNMFSRPFYFTQLQNGTIVEVQHSPNENPEVANIKKSLASLFQTHTKYGDSDVEEEDASSVHMAHYRVEENRQGVLTVKKQVHADDVKRFPEGSGADPSVVHLEESEEIHYKHGEPERLSGRIKTSITQPEDRRERDSTVPESEEYKANSHLDEILQVEGHFSLQVKGRRKRRSPRSLPANSIRLRSSSLMSKVDKRDTIRTHLNYMKQKAESAQVVLEAIRLGQEDVLNRTYHRFLMLLDLEGHCEFLQCSSSEETPIANAMVDYFYEADPTTKMRLLSSLVASGSRLAQQALNDVLVSPKLYDILQRDVLHAIAFLERPSSQIINTVTDLCNSPDPDVKSSAVLAVGALARHSSYSVSDSITYGLLDKLAVAQSSQSTTEGGFVLILLHALSNTRNVHAAEALVKILTDSTSENSELQLTASVALGDFIELESVVETFIALLQSNQSVSDIVAGVVSNILTSKLIIDHPPANIPHLVELESALYQKMNGHPIPSSPSKLHSNRSQRDTIIGTTEFLVPNMTLFNTSRCFHSERTSSKFNNTQFDDLQCNDTQFDDPQFNDTQFDNTSSLCESDEIRYPLHKSYLFDKTLGVDKLHLRGTVKAFGGMNFYRKIGKAFLGASAYAHAFGYTKEFAKLSFKILLNETFIQYQSLIRIMGKVVLQQSKTGKTCFLASMTLLKPKTFKVFGLTLSVPVPILGAKLNFALQSHASYSVTGDLNICPLLLSGSAAVTGEGGLTASVAAAEIEILVLYLQKYSHGN
jgi:hypothetical protein